MGESRMGEGERYFIGVFCAVGGGVKMMRGTRCWAAEDWEERERDVRGRERLRGKEWASF